MRARTLYSTRMRKTSRSANMFLFLFVVFFFLGVETYDDRLVTVDYSPSPDELGKTVMLRCCTNGIATRGGEVPDFSWQTYLNDPAIPGNAVGVNSHTLFLPNFTSEQVGLYRCKVSSFTTRYSAYIGVGSTEVTEAPGTIRYSSQRYSTPHLDCILSNSDAPIASFNYVFYRHFAPMPSQAYVDRRSLYVPGFNDDDVGIYSCTAFNADGTSYGHPFEWFLDFPADPPPYPTITPNAPTEELKTGTVMALTCCSNGVPPPQYAWLKRNWVTDAVEPLTNAAGLFSSTLYVPITGVSDSGIYACIIFNSAGTSITETLVNLSPEGPPYFLTVSPSPVYISRYQQKLIDCVAGGDPYPTLSWRRVNGTLPPYSNWNHEGLTLTDLGGGDVSGVYVCTATNVNGVAERAFEVLYTSSITETPTTAPTTLPTESYEPPVNVTVTGQRAVVEGTDLVLNCSADGEPRPTYQWLRSGSSLPAKAVHDGTSLQLVVPSMAWADVGVYYCLAINAGGVSYSPAVYVLLLAEEGAVISYGTGEEESVVDPQLLGGVFGGVVSVVAVISLAATALAWYMSRPVEHALEEPATVWDVLVGQHKDKNMFDLIVKVQPGQQVGTREPSLISLGSRILRNLNVTSRVEQPFEDCRADGQPSCGEAGSREIGEEVVRGWEEGVEGRGLDPRGSTSVVVEVAIEEEGIP